MSLKKVRCAPASESEIGLCGWLSLGASVVVLRKLVDMTVQSCIDTNGTLMRTIDVQGFALL